MKLYVISYTGVSIQRFEHKILKKLLRFSYVSG